MLHGEKDAWDKSVWEMSLELINRSSILKGLRNSAVKNFYLTV